jgi:EAL domain-containing protein (putative c-di-GMP-specific phosphodiesterase class I)
LLVRAAARVRATLPEGTMMARLHGDGFAILIDEGETQSVAFAQRIHEAFSSPIAIRGLDIPVSLSIGIAECKGESVTSGTLLRDAHSAVRAASSHGASDTRVFDAELHERSRMQLQLEAALREATHQNALEVYYQPICEMGTGKIVGCEALSRWNHPLHGPISPDLFIPLAEDTGLIETLGTWVLREACETAATWARDQLEEISVSVNIAPQQFLSGHLPELIRTVLEETQFPPQLLKLEITERSVFEERQTERDSLQAIRDLGVRLVIDDFGTGYSSFEYLTKLAVDEIKLDRTFIDKLDEDTQLQKVVHAMVNLAHNLGLKVTAEGIESEEQLLLLRGLQCDYGQGYLLNAARPAEEFSRLLGNNPPDDPDTSDIKSPPRLTLAKG